MAKRSVQIDELGHARVEAVARQVGLTQEAAASLLVRAATDVRVRELLAEAAGRLQSDRPASGGEPSAGRSPAAPSEPTAG